MKDFWRSQDSAFGLLLGIYMHISELIEYGLSLISFYYLKITSAGVQLQITIRDNHNQIAGNQIHPVAPHSEVLLYFIQLVTFPFLVVLMISPVLLFASVWWLYCDYTFLRTLFGPYGLNVLPFYTTISLIYTHIDLQRFFPYYNPVHGKLLCLEC
jgi:hypothetical protein